MEQRLDFKIGKMFPQLNVSEITRTIGMNKSLLSKCIYFQMQISQT